MEGFSENCVKVNQSCGGCKNVARFKLGFTTSLHCRLSPPGICKLRICQNETSAPFWRAWIVSEIFENNIYRITALSSLLLWPANMRSIILKKIIWAKSIKTKISTEVAVGLVGELNTASNTTAQIFDHKSMLWKLFVHFKYEIHNETHNQSKELYQIKNSDSFIKSNQELWYLCDTFSGHLTLNPGKLSSSPV